MSTKLSLSVLLVPLLYLGEFAFGRGRVGPMSASALTNIGGPISVGGSLEASLLRVYEATALTQIVV